MNHIGKAERPSQDRIVQLFQNELGYRYLGNWQDDLRTQPVEEDLLRNFLKRQGYSAALIDRAVSKFLKSVTSIASGLYDANKEVYKLLRYGVNVREELGEAKESVWLIDWANPENNDFAIAEEVSFKGKHNKRPDIVIYVNGIALGVLELKSSRKGLTEGIRQNLDNQSDHFIPKFFTTIQLVLAGNDTQGLRYGTIKTSEKYYLKWKEQSGTAEYDYVIDTHLVQLCAKGRILEIIKDFTIFDKGVKKLCRPNQYFGIKAAQKRIYNKEGGIIWHTQGSGKSLTMVWLTKWIRQNIDDSRVLIITDREELDDQIEKLFIGVEEQIYRTSSGRDLLNVLNHKTEMLICSLVHKFGNRTDEPDYDKYIQELKESLGSDFKAKGNLYVFVDECHRTQSGKLHEAMKAILPEALFIGFTGTPLLKKDKQKSIEVFGPYIGKPYKFDEAVEDGVVLDLLYEARDVEQFVTDQDKIDEWFDAKTEGLTDIAKIELKRKWGTMQKVLGSKSRLAKIVNDIIHDFDTKPRLFTGEGNAMLVSGSVYQACKYYELFQQAGFKECAIITSYQPHHADIKGEDSGESSPTEKLLKYEVYTQMLKGKTTEVFEEEVKEQFIKEPGRMKLLIVVDKLLTGFDAPSATYLYIDKSMQDHGLFQAICRVNRVDKDDKEYGYIIDYKDLFESVERSIHDYTSGAFDKYDEDDVKGLLKDRFEESRDRLETALERVKAICESVHPKDEPSFIRYFCGNTEIPQDIKDREELRVALYKAVVSLIRAYTNVANEMGAMGYTAKESETIKDEVKFYTDLRETIKKASRDYVDLKRFESGMRQLMDRYIDAMSSKKISDFENKSLVELIVNLASEPDAEYKTKKQEAVAETIENNVRKVIIEESQANPRYYEKMSRLLDELIAQRKKETLAYQEYLKKIKELAELVTSPQKTNSYPQTLDNAAKRALYDNLDHNEILVLALDNVIKANKLDGWRDGAIKERKLRLAIQNLLNDEEKTTELMEIIKAQRDY
ncbi:type I restriction endonuclease subunit R [Leeuwenhoekiella marinoflava]|uniref:Type I restriction enzyme endonuclease subunit n=2 Tax=Leeuwenhoekiella marinoflava TaxID=988 RepID=A0A4Q0PLG3_9FLAO|nr:HsdR family type I site-specific deoxyribonuclease [Leeuwenhoekiella marinoflava]RXG29885.1 type I restriction enzyme R subunit [Leeuwenhoekiella marinoflava]SHF27326.1 type I restriction enzyme, R subunit [Leeuwenhoekiella marinoflava DSM 3653]